MQSLNLGLQSLNHSDLSLKIKTALKCISAAVEGIRVERVQYRLLEKTTKLQKEEKNHEVGSQYNLQQAVRNTANQ
jgi:hypothetical protein